MKITQRDYQLDVIKAFSITFVLFWHLEPFNIVSDQYVINQILSLSIQFFYRQICLLAVPVFILVSLYLFFSKIVSSNFYFVKRTKSLFKIFGFWILIQSLISYLVTGIISQPSIEIIIIGGPELPVVGGSVFYYLFDLIVLTVISFLYVKLNKKIKLCVAWIVIVGFLVYFEVSNLLNQPIPQPLPFFMEFILYIPVAFYLFKVKENFLKFKNQYLLAYILFSIQDFYLILHLHYQLPIYSRLSIFFGTLTFISIIYSYKLRETKLVKLLSKYALGIYALHKYWQYFFIWLMKESNSSTLYTHVFSLTLDLIPIAISLMTIAFTCLSVYLLSFTYFKKFVS